MKENKTNTLLLTVIGVATLLVAVIGASFAYFTAAMGSGETATTITVGAGTLNITYATGDSSLVAEQIMPQPAGVAAITKDFTVTGNNTTDANMPYSLELVVQANTFEMEEALTYSLDSTNTGANGTIVPSRGVTGIPEGPSTIDLGSGFFAGAVTNKDHTYVLKIFFTDTGVNQDDDKSKSFSGYINVKVQEIYTTS